MRKLKVLFNTSPGAFGNWGGGEIQLLETKKGLEALGHEVNIVENDKVDDFSGFDLFHNFNIHRDSWPFVEKAKQAGLPIAVSTIYWPWNKHIWNWDIGFVKKVMAFAAELAGKFSGVNKIIKNANILLPNSKAEAEILKHKFGVGMKKIHVVPNGVDKRFKGAAGNLFIKKFRVQNFVLYIGRIEERKNVLSLIKAMKGIDEKLVVIGNTKQNSEAYFEKCKKAAGSNVMFLDSLPHDSGMLEAVYAASKVFCLPSWYETPGLAALEAGLAGANIVVTKEGCAKEYFIEHALYIDPSDIADIRAKILAALQKPKGNELEQHIEKKFLWEKAAEKTLEAYKIILGEK